MFGEDVIAVVQRETRLAGEVFLHEREGGADDEELDRLHDVRAERVAVLERLGKQTEFPPPPGSLIDSDVPRPCGAAPLVELTPHYTGGWAEPLHRDPVPWGTCGSSQGFDHPFTVREDDDWNHLTLDRDSGVAVRYVLVPLGEYWELRAGITQRAAMAAETGGMHHHMFSGAEQAAASEAGKSILSGWIHGISADHITIG